ISQLHELLRLSFFSDESPTTEIYTLSLHDALPILLEVIYPNPGAQQVHIAHKLSAGQSLLIRVMDAAGRQIDALQFDKNELAGEIGRATSELQSRENLVCRLLLEKKKKKKKSNQPN